MSGCSSGVEHNLAKVGVERSNRFTRSILPLDFIVFVGILAPWRLGAVLAAMCRRPQVAPQPVFFIQLFEKT